MEHGIFLNRRSFSAGLAATTGASLLPKGVSAQLQDSIDTGEVAGAWREFGDLTARAAKLGLIAPRMTFGPETASADYDKVVPALWDLIASIEAQPRERSAAPQESEALLNDAADLLSRVHAAEHVTPAALLPPEEFAPELAPGNFDSLKAEYEELFSTCQVRDQYRGEVDQMANLIVNNRARYEEVETSVCVPWFAVAVIHAMEASLNFRGHLHNGDPLSARTRHVPRNRPPVWLPPSDWKSSAIDALQFEKMTNLKDWGLARTLYRWEGYNGWGSRAHGVNTPYLWSYSNHYSKGKYVADGVWSGSAVSKQCGAAVILKELVTRGAIAFA